MVASESVALDTQGFTMERDLAPGEALFVDSNGAVHTRQCAQDPVLTPCIFEHVYFARPDSVMDNIFVHKARMRMGEKLARKIEREWPNQDIDVVIPIPDTSRTSAMELAHELGVKYREGFIKNRYIGRTFIMPGQELRKKSVRQKLNPIAAEFRGKNVLLVDDSVVRGTTSREIVQMARDVGAKKVYFASAAPAIRYPNIYGIDMPSSEELIAYGRTEDEVGEAIGADRMIYQELQDLIAAVGKGNKKIEQFDCSVFTGEYVTEVSQEYLDQLKDIRGDKKKEQRVKKVAAIDLHNNP
jgi:amidophosphoribosyltransferase